MFNQNKFSNILSQINSTYSTMTDFGKKASFDRTYISKYINKKLKNPPTPKILEKIANASNGIISYNELMEICGYINRTSLSKNTYPCITDKEWKEIFGTNASIKLTDNESIVWAEMLEKIPTSNKANLENEIISIDYDLNDYCKRATSINEEKKITQLFFFFLLLVCKKIGTSKDCEKIMNAMRQQKIIDLNNTSLNIYKENNTGFYMCPVYGRISAGQPNWAEECIEGRLPIDPNMMNIVDPEECYFLRVNGESMNKLVSNGAYALIRKTDWVENGEIAVVLVNGFDATLKKFSKQGDLVVLEPMSTDNSFQVQIYDKNTPIKIIGKYIGKFEMKN